MGRCKGALRLLPFTLTAYRPLSGLYAYLREILKEKESRVVRPTRWVLIVSAAMPEHRTVPMDAACEERGEVVYTAFEH